MGVKIEIELQDTPEKDLPRPGDGERFKKSKDQKNKKHPGNSPVIDTYGPETKIQEENYPLLSEQEMSVKEKISGWEDATIQSVTCKGSERWGKQRVKRETSSEQRVMPPPVQPTIPSPLSTFPTHSSLSTFYGMFKFIPPHYPTTSHLNSFGFGSRTSPRYTLRATTVSFLINPTLHTTDSLPHDSATYLKHNSDYNP